PLADAMRFVDGDEAEAGLLKQPAERAVDHDALGRDVEQPTAIITDRRQNVVAFVRLQRAVQVGGGNAVHAQAVDLVLHQRDERRNDDGNAATWWGRPASAEATAVRRSFSDGGEAAPRLREPVVSRAESAISG